MPTIILIDNGMHMATTSEYHYPLETIISGLKNMLDCINMKQKLEYFALASFSSRCEILSTFTRDYEHIKSRINMIQSDTTEASDLMCGLVGIEPLALGELPVGTICNILIFTHDKVKLPTMAPYQINGNMYIAVHADGSLPVPLIEAMGYFKCDFKFFKFDPGYTPVNIFKKIYEHFTPWIGTLNFGSLNCKVTLSPNPGTYTKCVDGDIICYNLENNIDICGFLDMNQVGMPPIVSRHIVSPCTKSILKSPQIDFVHEEIGFSDDSVDESHTPNFAVLLHGSLKMKKMTALCHLGNDWYGFIYAWTDSKKKSNLMISLLLPGTDCVPWLGNLDEMHLMTDEERAESEPNSSFIPVTEKKSYTQNLSCWIRESSLIYDVQKVLRHARKIPDKTPAFYKELNKVRRTALSRGFNTLIKTLAEILERECTSLPGSAHPACALQISNAVQQLRSPNSYDYRHNIVPVALQF